MVSAVGRGCDQRFDSDPANAEVVSGSWCMPQSAECQDARDSTIMLGRPHTHDGAQMHVPTGALPATSHELPTRTSSNITRAACSFGAALHVICSVGSQHVHISYGGLFASLTFSARSGSAPVQAHVSAATGLHQFRAEVCWWWGVRVRTA